MPIDLRILVTGQFILDLVILGVLIVLGRLYFNRKAATADFQAAMNKAMTLIREMEELGESLEKILGEKRELINRLMTDLDTRLTKAQVISEEIKKITSMPIHGGGHSQKSNKKIAATRKLIETLQGQGLSKDDICKRLGLPSGELELIMKLNSSPDKSSKGTA